MISSAGLMLSSGPTSASCTVSDRRGSGDVAAQVAELRLAAHHDGDVEVAARDGAARTRERRRLQHAELGDHRLRASAPTRSAMMRPGSR